MDWGAGQMGPRPALWGAALATALALSACTASVDGGELAADEVAATTPSTTSTTTTTAPPAPCPLDITESVTTTSKAVDIPGTTRPGYTVTQIAPSNEPIPVAADGTFTISANGYPMGTNPHAVVITVEGPGCLGVERGVEIVRTSPPTTKPKAKSSGTRWCPMEHRSVPSSYNGVCTEEEAIADAEFEYRASDKCQGAASSEAYGACYRKETGNRD